VTTSRLVVGVDVGTSKNLGIAIVTDKGELWGYGSVWYAEPFELKGNDLMDRVVMARERTRYILDILERNLFFVDHSYWFIETAPLVRGGRANVRTLKALTMIEAAVEIALRLRYVPFEALHPSTIKKGFTGNGRAKKIDVQNKVYSIFDEFNEDTKPIDENVADALAAAMTGLERLQL